MNPIISFNVISKQFSKHESGLLKLEYDINASAATTVYVQIHDWPTPAAMAAGLTVPTVGSVPIKSWPSPAGSIDVYKEFKRGELECTNGIFVCVSTTQATLTIGTGNNKFDSVAAELLSNDVVGTEVNSQSANAQVVWSQATGAANEHRIVRASCTNLDTGVRYLQMFPIDSGSLISGTTIPLNSWPMATSGVATATIIVSFGSTGNNNLGGIDVGGIDSTTHALQQGCSLAVSSTANVYTDGTTLGANFYAEYK